MLLGWDDGTEECLLCCCLLLCLSGDRFILQKADEKPVFNRSPSDLYFHYVEDRYILMGGTTTGNHKGYTDREFAAITESQEGLDMAGNPSPMDYINMVCSGMIRNFPVTP